MIDRAMPVDDAPMKVGLLMETAHAHQKLVETQLEQMRAHTRGLDGVVRDEIRRTLIEELTELTVESKRAAQALQSMKRVADARHLLSSIGIAVVCTAIPCAIAHWALPSRTEIAELQAERDRLTANIGRLERAGGRLEWRQCGERARLCVRIDRSAPTYGEGADFFIVKGF